MSIEKATICQFLMGPVLSFVLHIFIVYKSSMVEIGVQKTKRLTRKIRDMDNYHLGSSLFSNLSIHKEWFDYPIQSLH